MDGDGDGLVCMCYQLMQVIYIGIIVCLLFSWKRFVTPLVLMKCPMRQSVPHVSLFVFRLHHSSAMKTAAFLLDESFFPRYRGVLNGFHENNSSP